MRIVHYLPDSIFSKYFINTLIANQLLNNQVFLSKTVGPHKYLDSDYVEEAPIKSKKFAHYQNILTAEDIFIVHYPRKPELNYYYNLYQTHYRLGWVFWGAEFYYIFPLKSLTLKQTYEHFKYDYLPNLFFTKNNILKHFEAIYYKYKQGRWQLKLKHFANLTSHLYHFNKYEINLIKSTLDCKKLKHINFVYSIFGHNQIFDQNILTKDNSSNYYIVGNAIGPLTNYFDVLQYLKTKDTIKFLCSYGDSKLNCSFKNLISKSSKFGNIEIVEDFLPYDKFEELIANAKGYILGAKRPMAMGNIFLCFHHRIPLYVYKDSHLFRSLQEMNFKVYDIMKFPTARIEIELSHNRKLVNEMFGRKTVNNMYQNLFMANN